MSILKKCRVCESSNLEEIIDFGKQPWCNDFLNYDQLGKEKFYPLVLVLCNECKVSQLNYTVKKEIMFSDHTYLSGVTKSLSAHFENLRNEIVKKFDIREKKKILDLGSNDGTFLKHFKNIGWKVLGVEPSKAICQIANENGIETLNKFFNFQTSQEINEKFDFINASGVFFHLEELHSFTKGVENLLNKDGVFIIQFLYMESIINNTAFDQIYHEHLLYYNLLTLNKLLLKHNLEIFDAHLHEIHGGQMTAYVSRVSGRKKTKKFQELLSKEIKNNANEMSRYLFFKDNIQKLRLKNIKYVNEALKNEKKIFGLGAPAKGNTLLNYFGFKSKHISKLLEINTLRRNLYAPGSHIPIEIESEIEEQPDIYYVLAWNFKNEILNKNKHLIDDGIEFYFPIDVA